MRKTQRHKDTTQDYHEFIDFLRRNFDKRHSGIDVCVFKAHQNRIKAPTFQTVYNWIKNDLIDFIKNDDLLRQNGDHHSRARHFENVPIEKGIPIWLRPRIINHRERFGDFEIDSILNPDKRSGIITLLDRKSRHYFWTRHASKQSYHIKCQTLLLINKIGLKEFNSLTRDRGCEFDLLPELGRELGFKIYVCNSYASCDKGSNENANGIFRRFFHKGTDLNKFTDLEIQEVFDKINNMRRRKFNYKSAKQMWESRNIKLN